MRYIYESRVVNEVNKTYLKHFRIFGLFGQYDVELYFDKKVNIYIGENGLGKTTILNCLYYVLEKKFVQLEEVPFESIEIKLQNARMPHSFTKADLIAYNRKRKGARGIYDEDFLQDLLLELNITLKDFAEMPSDYKEEVLRQFSRIQGIPYSLARKYLYQTISTQQFLGSSKQAAGDPEKIQKVIKAINHNIHERIIYLPTYRRIENDFSNLNIRNNEINNSEMLIRFGMADVQKSIDTILEKIRALAMQGFNKMTGLLLHQYTNDENIGFRYDPFNVDIVKIVLDRLGSEVEERTKGDIIRLVETDKINSYDHLHLRNLLQKLIENYDQQKHYDDCINGFVNTCNKYLRDKQFYYDPSNLTLKIYLEGDPENKKTIELTQLSSGEKQIISLFSKLYLEGEEKSLVIIDEPELSLSIRWQQMLLPDIMRSNNCSFLLTVTHSPFIFENEFDMDAREMRAHMHRG